MFDTFFSILSNLKSNETRTIDNEDKRQRFLLAFGEKYSHSLFNNALQIKWLINTI